MPAPLHQVGAVHGASRRPRSAPRPGRSSGFGASPSNEPRVLALADDLDGSHRSPCYRVRGLTRVRFAARMRADARCTLGRDWAGARAARRSPSCPTAARSRSRAARSRRPTRTPIRTRTRRCWCAPTRACCSRSRTASTAARRPSSRSRARARARRSSSRRAARRFAPRCAARRRRARGAPARAAARARVWCWRRCAASGVELASLGDSSAWLVGSARRARRRELAPARRSRAARARARRALARAARRAPAGARIALVSDGVTNFVAERAIPRPARRGAERSRRRARDRRRPRSTAAPATTSRSRRLRGARECESFAREVAMALAVKGIQHLNLQVADLARARAFYTELLGFQRRVREGRHGLARGRRRSARTLARARRRARSFEHFGFMVDATGRGRPLGRAARARRASRPRRARTIAPTAARCTSATPTDTSSRSSGSTPPSSRSPSAETSRVRDRQRLATASVARDPRRATARCRRSAAHAVRAQSGHAERAAPQQALRSSVPRAGSACRRQPASSCSGSERGSRRERDSARGVRGARARGAGTALEVASAALVHAALAIEKPGVLFVDDEVNILKSLARLFRAESGPRLHRQLGGRGARAARHRADPGGRLRPAHARHDRARSCSRRCASAGPRSRASCSPATPRSRSRSRRSTSGEIFRLLTKPWNDQELRATVRQALDDVRHARRGRRA